MKKIITLMKECNNPKIEEFVKTQILPNTKRYEVVELLFENNEELELNERSTEVIDKNITVNQIQNRCFDNIYFENCYFRKANISHVPLDTAPLVPINAILKNCYFVNCTLQDLNSMTLENCTFINSDFARQYDVNFSGSTFKNCCFLKINNEQTSRNLDFSNCSFEKCLIDRVFGCKFDNVDFTKHGAMGVLYNYFEKEYYPGCKNQMRFPVGYSSILLPTAYTNSYENYSFKGAKISKKDFLVMSKIWATNGLGNIRVNWQTKEGNVIKVNAEDFTPFPLIGPLTQGSFVVKDVGKENFIPTIEFDLKENSREFIVVDIENQYISTPNYLDDDYTIAP